MGLFVWDKKFVFFPLRTALAPLGTSPRGQVLGYRTPVLGAQGAVSRTPGVMSGTAPDTAPGVLGTVEAVFGALGTGHNKITKICIWCFDPHPPVHVTTLPLPREDFMQN